MNDDDETGGSRFTSEQVAEMVTDRNKLGMTYRAIAEKHGTVPSWVYELIGDKSTAPLTHDRNPIPYSKLAEMIGQYMSGVNLRELCADSGYSYGKVYRHLAPLVDFRPRGKSAK